MTIMPIKVELSIEISILNHDSSAVSNHVQLKLEKHGVNLNGHLLVYVSKIHM